MTGEQLLQTNGQTKVSFVDVCSSGLIRSHQPPPRQHDKEVCIGTVQVPKKMLSRDQLEALHVGDELLKEILPQIIAERAIPKQATPLSSICSVPQRSLKSRRPPTVATVLSRIDPVGLVHNHRRLLGKAVLTCLVVPTVPAMQVRAPARKSWGALLQYYMQDLLGCGRQAFCFCGVSLVRMPAEKAEQLRLRDTENLANFLGLHSPRRLRCVTISKPIHATQNIRCLNLVSLLILGMALHEQDQTVRGIVCSNNVVAMKAQGRLHCLCKVRQKLLGALGKKPQGYEACECRTSATRDTPHLPTSQSASSRGGPARQLPGSHRP